MNPKVVTALDTVPMFSIEDCRAHLRVTPDDDSPPFHPDDALILSKLTVARDWIERFTGLALTPRVLELALDAFPCNEIKLPVPPCVSIVSVKYIDEDGVQQTIDDTNYTLDTYTNPGWLEPASDFVWPATKSVINAVLIRYNVGYSFRTDTQQSNPLPPAIKGAVMLMMGSLYENREDEVAYAVTAIPTSAKALVGYYSVRKALA